LRFAGWYDRRSSRPLAQIWARPRQYCGYGHESGGSRRRIWVILYDINHGKRGIGG
jgi:hypothetical protein